MRISGIRDLLEAQVLCGGDRMDEDMVNVFASDMMSDVLACPDDVEILLTGLNNPQVIRTADMLDTSAVIFVGGKMPPDDMVEMARQRDMILLRTECRMFTACGRLYAAGIGVR